MLSLGMQAWSLLLPMKESLQQLEVRISELRSHEPGQKTLSFSSVAQGHFTQLGLDSIGKCLEVLCFSYKAH